MAKTILKIFLIIWYKNQTVAYLINPIPSKVSYFTIMKENFFKYTNK